MTANAKPSLSVEEMARKAAEIALPEVAPHDVFEDERGIYIDGFLAGAAASTRAAVIAELEAIAKEECPYCATFRV